MGGGGGGDKVEWGRSIDSQTTYIPWKIGEGTAEVQRGIVGLIMNIN